MTIFVSKNRYGGQIDGYRPESKTIFQYHGCFWHSCLESFPRPEQRTREAAYQRTLKRSEVIRFMGYNLVER